MLFLFLAQQRLVAGRDAAFHADEATALLVRLDLPTAQLGSTSILLGSALYLHKRTALQVLLEIRGVLPELALPVAPGLVFDALDGLLAHSPPLVHVWD